MMATPPCTDAQTNTCTYFIDYDRCSGYANDAVQAAELEYPDEPPVYIPFTPPPKPRPQSTVPQREISVVSHPRNRPRYDGVRRRTH